MMRDHRSQHKNNNISAPYLTLEGPTSDENQYGGSGIDHKNGSVCQREMYDNVLDETHTQKAS